MIGAYDLELVCRLDGEHFEQTLWQYKHFVVPATFTNVSNLNDKIFLKLYFLPNYDNFAFCISKGTVATCWKCDGKYYMILLERNLFPSLQLWKSRGEVLRRIGIARSCMNLLEKNNLEVKHQAGYQNTPLPYLHSSCLVVWVRNMVHHKAPVLSHWCIWHVGTTQDPEDTIHSPCDECGSQSNHRMPSALPPGHWQTFAALWTYCPQLSTRGPPPCSRCGDPGAASSVTAPYLLVGPQLTLTCSCSLFFVGIGSMTK